MDKTNLTDEDIHCMARQIQSVLFSDGLMGTCAYCKYIEQCHQDHLAHKPMRIDIVRRKLSEITELYLGYRYYDSCNPAPALEESAFKKLPFKPNGFIF